MRERCDEGDSQPPHGGGCARVLGDVLPENDGTVIGSTRDRIDRVSDIFFFYVLLLVQLRVPEQAEGRVAPDDGDRDEADPPDVRRLRSADLRKSPIIAGSRKVR